ncbi:MAG: FMN-binding protein [Spirochaetes bacterium]|nr:FMN-binding protein [Spirochaetota bacterium]
MKKDDLNPVKLSMILFLITAFSGFILSIVYSVTMPKIEANERIKEEESIRIIMPNVRSFVQKDDVYFIYRDENNKNLIGYVFKSIAKGYGGPVKCNVGIDLYGMVTGLVVSSHTETPGLGTKISEVREGEDKPYFLKQFKRLNGTQIDFNNIKAISGATVSSKAVLQCVNLAFKRFQEIR